MQSMLIVVTTPSTEFTFISRVSRRIGHKIITFFKRAKIILCLLQQPNTFFNRLHVDLLCCRVSTIEAKVV